MEWGGSGGADIYRCFLGRRIGLRFGGVVEGLVRKALLCVVGEGTGGLWWG